MTVKASAVRFNIDAANLLRAESAGPITVAEASGSKSLGAITAPGYAGEIAAPLDFSVVIFVTALDKTTGDEAYVVDVEAASRADFADKIVIGTATLTEIGHRVINIAKENLRGKEHVRVNVKPSGTTPSIDYWAMISPLGGK